MNQSDLLGLGLQQAGELRSPELGVSFAADQPDGAEGAQLVQAVQFAYLLEDLRAVQDVVILESRVEIVKDQNIALLPGPQGLVGRGERVMVQVGKLQEVKSSKVTSSSHREGMFRSNCRCQRGLAALQRATNDQMLPLALQRCKFQQGWN